VFLPPANVFERLLLNWSRSVHTAYKSRTPQHEDLINDQIKYVDNNAEKNAVEMATMAPLVSTSRVDSESTPLNSSRSFSRITPRNSTSASNPFLSGEDASDDLYTRTRKLSVDHETADGLPRSGSGAVQTDAGGGLTYSSFLRSFDDYDNAVGRSDSSHSSFDGGVVVVVKHPIDITANSQDTTMSNGRDRKDSVTDMLTDMEIGPVTEMDADTSALVSVDVTYVAEPPYWFMCSCRLILLSAATVVGMEVPCFNAVGNSTLPGTCPD
jgi:hypothetical protein